MAKQPYIPLYLGDYIKDTRVLPLNVKGGWVDLILAMWNNNPKGELVGTIDDYARIMNCSIDEANLVIQTLKQKKIFDYLDLDNGNLQIISRKQKNMEKLSEMRKNIGKTGGNPALVKQKEKQKDNLIAENEIIDILDRIKEQVEIDGNPENKFVVMVVLKMVEIFKNKFPHYPVTPDFDYAGCLRIAYKIAEYKGWKKSEVINGRMDDCLNSWRVIVDFIHNDTWLATRSIPDISTDKEWARLVQKMKQPKKKPETTEKTAPSLTHLKPI